ncbi:MAG: permease prefix domain 1-containing protein [Oscillospiraceae bacterium]|nr:permease prefix domain 1-containing protein [Oscillospiraceae bacterium]
METIKTYIDNVFAAFEQSERVSVLKRDMLAGMEEKYHTLKSEGKSEHEAVGSVISDFGNIGEIITEMGIRTNSDNSDKSNDSDLSQESDSFMDALPVTREEAFEFVSLFKKAGRWIGAGMWIVMTGICVMLLFLGKDGKVNEAVHAIGFTVFFIMLVPAVAIFIIHGMSLYRSKILMSGRIFLDSTTKTALENAKKEYIPKFAVQIVIGVSIILVYTGLFFILATSYGMEIEAVALFMVAIGLATLFFVSAGMTFGAYEMLFSKAGLSSTGVGYWNGNVVHKMNSQKGERLISTVAAVFFPLMTAAYLLWSFTTGKWEITWIIWPVAGVLFGAFAGGVSTWYEGK